MNRGLPVQRTLLLIGLIAAALAACAGGSPPADPPTPDPRTPASAPATAPPAGRTGEQPIEACALLTDEEILELTGFAVQSKVVSRLTTVFPSGCDWQLDGDASLSVGVRFPGGRAYYDTYFEPFIGEDEFASLQEHVSGIGDKAARGEAGDLMAVQGDALVQVEYFEFFSSGEDDVPAELMQIVLSRLP